MAACIYASRHTLTKEFEMSIKLPPGIRGFEIKLLKLYKQMFQGLEVTGQAQRYYNALNKNDVSSTFWLSHEAITIMYDLGVKLHGDDPLKQKLFFTIDNISNKTYSKLNNPYFSDCRFIT